MPEPTGRTERCCACGRPVWGVPAVRENDEPGPPPDLCDYCAAAAH